jgi:penicillin amidase
VSSHRPFSNVKPLAKFFEVHSASAGDPFTVNVGQYWPNEPILPFANRHAASMRTLFDLNNLEESRFIYQTGQSGLVFSERYRDMAQPWSAGQTRPMQMQPANIAHTLTLRP